MEKPETRPFRSIPPVNTIAAHLVSRLGENISPELARSHAAEVQKLIRQHLELDASKGPDAILEILIDELERRLLSPKLARVLNGTGIVIHTNLGRAAVSEQTAEAMQEAASGAVALEIEPVTGQRGGRMSEISTLFRLLTSAEDSLVVNNNAAGVLLVLAALARDRRVAVSRSEAVEIGGGFRIPDVLSQSGATMVEVGTTNRTYATDFERAAEAGADLFLKIHPSNFSVQGFVAAPTLEELREVADRSKALLIEDLGSGTLLPTDRYGMDHEPMVQESIAAGVDIVTFSGDKLLGGPQAGIILGRRSLIDRIGSHPLARAVRADKATLAGVAETLRHYAKGDVERAVPVWRMMATLSDHLKTRAEQLASSLTSRSPDISTVSTINHVGGGALPGQSLPGWAIRIGTESSGEATSLARSFRTASPIPVFPRVEDDAVLVELRTIPPEDDLLLVKSIQYAMSTRRA